MVASTRAFVVAAENSSNPTGLEPGYFILNSHMQASLAWAALLNPKNRDQSVVTLPEGKRASQVIAIMAKETKIPLKDFQQVLDHPAQLGLPSYAKGKAEGYLFPATYTIQPHETALQILQAMVARFKVEAQQIDLPAAAAGWASRRDEVIIERQHGAGRGRLRLRLSEDRRGNQQPAQDRHGPAVRQRAALRAQQVRDQRHRQADRHEGPVQRLRAHRPPAGPDL